MPSPKAGRSSSARAAGRHLRSPDRRSPTSGRAGRRGGASFPRGRMVAKCRPCSSMSLCASTVRCPCTSGSAPIEGRHESRGQAMVALLAAGLAALSKPVELPPTGATNAPVVPPARSAQQNSIAPGGTVCPFLEQAAAPRPMTSRVDASKHVGRIYRHDTAGGERTRWFWAMNASGPGINRSDTKCSGLADTKAEALRLVEETYWACRV